MKQIYLILIVFLLAGCASKDLDYSPKDIYKDYNASWQYDFNSTRLNNLIKMAIEKNEDLAIATLNLNIALRRAGLSRQDLLPSFSAGFGGSLNRNVNMSDSWKKGFNSEFALSWQLDIFGKLYDAYESKNYNALKSSLDLKSVHLSVVNSVIDEYFHILYLNDKISNLSSNLTNLEQLHQIIQIKFQYGKETRLSLAQSSQNLLNLRNSLLSAQKELQSAYENLNNLTDNKDKFDDEKLSNLALSELDLGIELSQDDIELKWLEKIQNRPDINAALSALNAGFYDYRSSKKAFLPSVSLGASLSDSDEKFNKAFGFEFFSSNLRVNLPFLDYFRLKDNLKISEYEFEILRLNYEKALKNAINETIKFANFYINDKTILENMQNIVLENEQILQIYEHKYELGGAELKDFLEAKNNFINSQNSLINQKYILLSDKISFLRSSGSE